MKILHLATIAYSHRRLLLPQLVALRDAGHEVVAVSAPGPDVAVLEENGIRHLALDGSTRGFDLRSDLRAARSFASIVRRERPDVVHTHNPKPGVYGRIVARVLGVGHVVNTVHGLYATPDDRLLRRLVVYGLEGIASRFSHLELVQNIEDVELMLRSPIAPSHIVRHLGNGIDVGRFQPERRAQARAAVRAELGIADDRVAIVSVGRLVAEKGINELLAACKGLDERHVLVVIGPHDPEKADAIDEAALDRARGDGVRLLGHRGDVDRILAGMDVFALASYREGVPRAAMEAAASGLPVVATDIRGCRQVVDHGRTGMLVPARSADELSAALARLIDDPELRDRMGRAGRQKAEAEFDERDVLRRLFSAYEELGIISDSLDLTDPDRPAAGQTRAAQLSADS